MKHRFRVAYDNGRKDDIVSFAAEKLSSNMESVILYDDENNERNRLGIKNFDEPLKKAAIAAILNVHFLMYADTHRVLPPIEEQEQVASNLLTIVRVPEHRQYMHIGHAPEPLVSEASAQLLDVPRNLGRIIKICDILFDTVLSGSKVRGDRGEFVARLLLMAAHDRTAIQQEQRDSQLMYTKPLKVVDFLKNLLKEEYHEAILNMKPQDQSPSDVILKEAFENAYVNFTNYIKAEDSAVCNYSYAWQALVRSVAIQCSPNQEDVDIVIPIAFSETGNEATLGRRSTSAVLIQVKNRDTPKSDVNINMDKIRFFYDRLPNQTYAQSTNNKRPFITIVMELGEQRAQDAVTIVGRNIDVMPSTRSQDVRKDHPQYNFVISGVTNVYKGIDSEDTINLRSLLVSKTPDIEYPRKTLEKQDAKLLREYNAIRKESTAAINCFKIGIKGASGQSLLP